MSKSIVDKVADNVVYKLRDNKIITKEEKDLVHKFIVSNIREYLKSHQADDTILTHSAFKQQTLYSTAYNEISNALNYNVGQENLLAKLPRELAKIFDQEITSASQRREAQEKSFADSAKTGKPQNWVKGFNFKENNTEFKSTKIGDISLFQNTNSNSQHYLEAPFIQVLVAKAKSLKQVLKKLSKDNFQ